MNTGMLVNWVSKIEPENHPDTQIVSCNKYTTESSDIELSISAEQHYCYVRGGAGFVYSIG